MLAAIGMFGLVLAPFCQAVTISPILDSVAINPGEGVFRTMTIFNEGDEEEEYYLFAKNFSPTGEEGEVLISEEQYGLTEWIVFPARSVAVGPKESVDVDFSINVPQNADPGGHYAAVFASTRAPEDLEGVGLSSNVGMLLLVRVEGDITEDVRLLDFNTIGSKKVYNHLPVKFEYRLENRGTVHVKPEGTIKVSGLFGKDEANANPDNSRNLPNSIRRIDAQWSKGAVEEGGFFTDLKNEWKNFGLGYYKANLDITYGANDQQIVGETSFWVFPWRVMLSALVIIIAAIILILLYNKAVVATATRKKKK